MLRICFAQETKWFRQDTTRVQSPAGEFFCFNLYHVSIKVKSPSDVADNTDFFPALASQLRRKVSLYP